LISCVIIRFILFFLLPKNPSSFGPDEGTYGQLADFVAKGLPVQEFPDLGPGLYYTSRSLILPSSFLAQTGIGGLQSVRIISSLYGFLTTVLLYMCLVAILQRSTAGLNFMKEIRNRTLVIICMALTFIPSPFLWSLLGLRESTSNFWLLSTFYFVLKLQFHSTGILPAYVLLSSCSLAFAFGGRKESALVLGAVLLISGLYLVLKKQNFSILAIAILGILVGQLYSTSPEVRTEKSFQLAPKQTFGASNSGKSHEVENVIEKNYAKNCQKVNQEITFAGVTYVCQASKTILSKTVNPSDLTKNVTSILKDIESQREKRSINAKSALPVQKCEQPSNSTQFDLACNVEILPYRLSSFLVRPLPLIDSGSLELTIASFENLLWLLLYLTILFQLFKKKIRGEDRFILIILFTYIAIFASFASLYDGNLGTAFRHKSSILWTLAIIIFISISYEMKNKSKIHLKTLKKYKIDKKHKH
jgi:hypothetical protein